MMGVYIKGMEMPTSCAFCRFNGAYCYAKGDEDAHSTLPCPLIPVPPHGDLIDRDALLSQYNGNIWTAQTDYAEGLRDVAKGIADAPTIIPADKEET